MEQTIPTPPRFSVPALLVNQSWSDLLRIAQVPADHALHQVKATSSGHFVVNEQDVQQLAAQLVMPAASLRRILLIASGLNWVGRLGSSLLARYARLF